MHCKISLLVKIDLASLFELTGTDSVSSSKFQLTPNTFWFNVVARSDSATNSMNSFELDAHSHRFIEADSKRPLASVYSDLPLSIVSTPVIKLST